MIPLSRDKILMFAVPLLAVIMAMVWWPRLRPAGKPSSAAFMLAEVSEKDSQQIGVLLAQADRRTAPTKSGFTEWGRNPFYQSKAAPVINELEMFPLKGIFYNEENPSALIGEEVFVVGDKVGPFTITNIQPKMVVISDGHKVIKLQLEDEFKDTD